MVRSRTIYFVGLNLFLAIVAGGLSGVYFSSRNVATAPAPATALANEGRSGSGSCDTDQRVYCPGISDPQKIDSCLHDHRHDLSDLCRAQVESVASTFKMCSDEISRYCASVPYGGGRMLECLMGKQNLLSENCRRRVGLPVIPTK